MTAPPKAMRSLMAVVDRLDVRRAQVIIEAMLVEVSTDASRDLGVNWVVDGSGDNFLVGLFNTPIAGVSLGDIARGVQDPSSVTSAPGGFTIGGGRREDSGTNFAAILRALASNGDTNVVSMPSVITLDNEEAQIKVAQEVPFLTGTFTNTGGAGGAVNPFQTIERKEVGNILKITPQITDEDTILLKIEQEASGYRGGRRAGLHDRPRDQQADHLDARAGRRRRHDRAGRPDRGPADRERIARAGARQDTRDRRPVPRAQHAEDQDQPHGLHPPARAAHGRAGGDRDQLEVQLPAGHAAQPQRRQGQDDAGLDAADAAAARRADAADTEPAAAGPVWKRRPRRRTGRHRRPPEAAESTESPPE